MNYVPIPTIVPLKNWMKDAANTEARMLRTAVLCHDIGAIIKTFTNHSNSQRLYIRQAYDDEFNRDLVMDLKTELMGDFRLLAAGLVLKPMDYAAKHIEKALGRADLNVKTLMDILTPCSKEQIDEIKECYKARFGEDLKEKVLAETSSYLRMVFLKILENNRQEETAVDQNIANRYVADFVTILEKTPERFKKHFICLLTGESREMLRVIFYEYAKLNTSLSLDQLIEVNFSGDLRVTIKAMVDIVRNLPQYYAERLFKAMNCWVSDNNTIMLIITSRSEIDLGNINSAYCSLFGHELARDIRFHLSGDFRRMLIAIIKNQCPMLQQELRKE